MLTPILSKKELSQNIKMVEKQFPGFKEAYFALAKVDRVKVDESRNIIDPALRDKFSPIVALVIDNRDFMGSLGVEIGVLDGDIQGFNGTYELTMWPRNKEIVAEMEKPSPVGVLLQGIIGIANLWKNKVSDEQGKPGEEVNQTPDR